MSNPIKIAIILPSVFPVPATKGGAIEMLVEFLVEENERNTNNNVVFVIYSAYEKEAVKKSKNYTKSTFFWIYYNSFLYKFINFFIRAARKILKIKLYNLEVLLAVLNIKRHAIKHIVIQGNTYYLEGISYYLGKFTSILHVHANIFDKLSPQNVYIASLCKKIINVSSFIKNEVVLNTQFDSQKAYVVMNGIPTPSRKGIYNRRSFDFNEQDIVITFVGRITRSKGIIELINAFKTINNDNAKLLIAGSFGSNFNFGDNDEHFRKEVENLCVEISNKVVFTGYISNQNIGDIYELSDIVVVPSLCEEAAGLVVIEALHCGKPLIVSAIGGIPEYVSSKNAIFINKSGCFVQDLSNALLKLIENEELRNIMSNEAKKYSKYYTSQVFYDNFINAVLSE